MSCNRSHYGLHCAAILSLLVGVIYLLHRPETPAAAADPPMFQGPAPFSHWPQDRKPEVVLVLSGQTYGYLSPCGCSRPQRGGLERRANLMDDLRKKGWPVVGLDLGDIAPPKPQIRTPEQDWLKYETMMKSLRAMGYAAVGLGVYDFEQQLFDLLARFTMQNPKDPRPIILAANLVGKPDKDVIVREEFFRAADARPMIEDVEVITRDPNGGPCLPIGVVGAIEASVYTRVRKIDPTFEFLSNADALKAALAKLKQQPVKPAINVLLYAANLDEATKAAKALPEFQLILCQIEESEPPQFPTMVNDNKTMIVQVGHKGQNVGIVGVFKTDAGYELKYQLVPLGEEYLTQKDQVPSHKVLNLLEDYARQVKERDFLAKAIAKPLDHPAMIQNPNAKLTYIGADKCIHCHPNEGKIWKGSKHSHAYEALEKLAYNPGLRQYDPDCVSCHSTGYSYRSGFEDEKKTPHLKHNGCENCHGPGSGHAANPSDKKLLAALMPWRTDPTDKMPAKATLEALAQVKPGQPAPVQLTPKEKLVVNSVSTMCMRCHDGENDPKFDINVYFPQIWHSGFKAAAGAGLPGIAK